MSTPEQTAERLTRQLQAIDYDRLPISDYNKQYIAHMKPVLGYYMRIFAQCLRRGLELTGMQPADITCVDYGGGSGFFSLFAKAAGIGRILYVDLNPLSVHTVSVLRQETGLGPDVVLEGNSDRLAAWCLAQQIHPQLLIATDLIEHVYDLSPFFGDLMRINPEMHLLFTTASTPWNPLVVRRLHRMMDACEKGDRVLLNYYNARLRFIREQYPHLSEAEAEAWSQRTRGLIYADIRKAIDSGHCPPLPGRHNTCDPASGNWAERILPLSAYTGIAATHHYTLHVQKGFYNTERNNPIASRLFEWINRLIRMTGKAGFLAAPFILLLFSPGRKEKK